eukprot:8685433-Pyramimonas_sp.AAC.1
MELIPCTNSLARAHRVSLRLNRCRSRLDRLVNWVGRSASAMGKNASCPGCAEITCCSEGCRSSRTLGTHTAVGLRAPTAGSSGRAASPY